MTNQRREMAIYYEGGSVNRFWLAPAGLGVVAAKTQRVSKLYRSREGARRGLLAHIACERRANPS